MSGRFADTSVSREGRYSLGRDRESGDPYLSIPVANRAVTYEEYYRLTPEQHERFTDDPPAARAFADECRQRRHDALLILAPGSDRGVAV